MCALNCSLQVHPFVRHQIDSLPLALNNATLPNYYSFLRKGGPWMRTAAEFGGSILQVAYTTNEYVKVHTEAEWQAQAQAGFLFSVTLDAKYGIQVIFLTQHIHNP
jgi:hypothetical protein